MKMVWSFLIFCIAVFSVSAADKLPAYGSPQWNALPGLKEVKAAAEKGDADAQYLLAIAVYNGKAKQNQLIETYDREWELKALAQGVSIYDSPLMGRDPQKVFAIYRNFAEKGFYMAQRTLAEMLMSENRREAIEWYLKAAEQGDDVSQYNIGKAYWEEEFGKCDPEMTLKYWELAAAQNNAGALKDLGVFWKDGFNGKRDTAKALKYFELAVEKGDTPAAYILGEIYSEGRYGIPVDKDLAIKYFRKAAEKEKHVAIQIKRTADLHFQYAMSYDQKKDFAKRDDLLKSAAKLGHKEALVIIIRNKFSEGNEKEKVDALKEMTALAERGNSYAQLNLCALLFSLKRNKEAVLWYCRALGNGEFAAYTIAPEVLWQNAENLTAEHKNFLKGVFLRADYLDDQDMQYLAMFLSSKKIVQSDDEKSYKYHDLLLKKGYPKVLFPYLCLILQEQSGKLSDSEKADIVLQIEKLTEFLRSLAANDDNEATSVLEEYSDIVKKNRK